MAGFYIKRIIARSDSKEDAIVEFTYKDVQIQESPAS